MAGNFELSPETNKTIGKVAEWIEDTDKGLDNVKEEVHGDLDKLQKEFVRSKDRDADKLAANIYISALAGFKEDLSELQIYGKAQEPYIAAFQTEWEKAKGGVAGEMETLFRRAKTKEALKSAELKAMDDFISTMQNLPLLAEAAQNAESMTKIESMLKGLLGGIPGMGDNVDGAFTKILEGLGLGGAVGWLFKKSQEEEGKDDEEKEGKEKEKANDTKENTDRTEAPKSPEDQKIFEENVALLKKQLEGQTSILALLNASENQSDLFKVQGDPDIEAQKEAVKQHMTEACKNFGELENIEAPTLEGGIAKPGILVFKQGEKTTAYEISQGDEGDIGVRVQGSENFNFVDNSFEGLMVGLESIEKMTNEPQ